MRSHTVFQIKMLNDEDVYVFITEFIEGRNLRKWKAENFHPEDPAPVPPALTNYFEKGIKMVRSESRIRTFTEVFQIPLFMDGLALLHASGQGIVCMQLLHCPDHVILVEDANSEVTGAVFVEFQTSIMLNDLVDETRLMEFETMCLLSHVVRCCPTHGRIFAKWMQAERIVVPEHLFVGVDLSDQDV